MATRPKPQPPQSPPHPKKQRVPGLLIIAALILIATTALAADTPPQPCADHRETISGQIEVRCHGESATAPAVVASDASRVITLDRAMALDLAKAIIAADRQSADTDLTVTIRGPQSDITRLWVALHLALGGAAEQRVGVPAR